MIYIIALIIKRIIIISIFGGILGGVIDIIKSWGPYQRREERQDTKELQRNIRA